MTTTLNIHSTGLIYSPGMFEWIMHHGKGQKRRKAELLAALGIPAEYVEPIIKGQYDKRVEGETLVITMK